MNEPSSRFDLTDSERDLRRQSRELAQQHFASKALEWEREATFPWDNLRLLAQAGLLGATVPQQYGGKGAGWLTAAIILEEVAQCCYATAMAALGELGVQTQAIVAYGTETQKAKYLPRVAQGDLVCSVCITEDDAGSDVTAIKTALHDEPDGSWTLNGTKALISRADVAELFLVFARRDASAGSAGEDFAVLLIDAETPGVSIGERQSTLGGEGLFRITFDKVTVTDDDILIPTDGFRRLFAAFNGQRCLNASISVGIAQGAQSAALQYAQAREQGGHPIGNYQGIRWMLADNEIEIQAARTLVRAACSNGSDGFPSRQDAAIAKTYANEMSLRVTDRVMQIFGGHGWLSEMPAERFLRWARYGPLGGGTPQVQRNGIARSLLRTGP